MFGLMSQPRLAQSTRGSIPFSQPQLSNSINQSIPFSLPPTYSRVIRSILGTSLASQILSEQLPSYASARLNDAPPYPSVVEVLPAQAKPEPNPKFFWGSLLFFIIVFPAFYGFLLRIFPSKNTVVPIAYLVASASFIHCILWLTIGVYGFSLYPESSLKALFIILIFISVINNIYGAILFDSLFRKYFDSFDQRKGWIGLCLFWCPLTLSFILCTLLTFNQPISQLFTFISFCFALSAIVLGITLKVGPKKVSPTQNEPAIAL